MLFLTRSTSCPLIFIISQIANVLSNLTFGRWQRPRGNNPQLPLIGRPVGIFKFPLCADWLVGGLWSRESPHRSGLLSVSAARRRGEAQCMWAFYRAAEYRQFINVRSSILSWRHCERQPQLAECFRGIIKRASELKSRRKLSESGDEESRWKWTLISLLLD